MDLAKKVASILIGSNTLIFPLKTYRMIEYQATNALALYKKDVAYI